MTVHADDIDVIGVHAHAVIPATTGSNETIAATSAANVHYKCAPLPGKAQHFFTTQSTPLPQFPPPPLVGALSMAKAFGVSEASNAPSCYTQIGLLEPTMKPQNAILLQQWAMPPREPSQASTETPEQTTDRVQTEKLFATVKHWLTVTDSAAMKLSLGVVMRAYVPCHMHTCTNHTVATTP